MKFAHAASNVVVTEMQYSEAQRGFFFGDLRTHAAAAYGETDAAFGFNAVLLPFDCVAINFGPISIRRLKNRADCVVPHHFVGGDYRWFNPLPVNLLTISVLTQVAFCFPEFFTELRFELFGSGCFARKLNRSSRVVQHLNGFESGKLVEEPSATRVHQH